VTIEKAGSNYSAYVTRASIAEVEQEFRDAIPCHIDGLKEDAHPIRSPNGIAEYVERHR